MRVVENIYGEQYEMFIKYATKENNIMAVTKYEDQGKEHDIIIDNIINKLGYTKEYVIENYSNVLICNMYKELKNDLSIFSDKVIERFKKISSYCTKDNYNTFIDNYKFDLDFKTEWDGISKNVDFTIDFSNISYDDYVKLNVEKEKFMCITSAVRQLYYDYIVETWLKKYKSNIIKKDVYKTHDFDGKEIIAKTRYYLKINNELIKDMLNRNSIYDWSFPYSIEDLSFYNNNECWFYSVAHEEIIDIFCKSKKEYNYLSHEIWISFEELEYERSYYRKNFMIDINSKQNVYYF